MKPLDPRLLKYARPARNYIIFIALLGLVVSILVLAQIMLISGAASQVITEGASLRDILPLIGSLAVVVTLRALVIYWRESRAHRAADQTIAQLRKSVIDHAVKMGPRWRSRRSADTVTLVTRGLKDLDPYFVRYLPQLLLVVTVTPICLLVILILDFWSALVALITIPLIPIFMILIGRLTADSSRQKLKTMERLSGQLLDALTGLPTLRALGTEKGPRRHLAQLSQKNNRTTMQTLRIAFLSGGVLEFISTLSVALVAVEVGFRMVSGNLSLFTGLAIIMLAPEVYEPLRQVGAQFHNSADGVAAAEAAFEILEQPLPPAGVTPAPNASNHRIAFDGLSVAARGAWAPDKLSATIEPGTITALTGSSGAGKTTALMVLMGLETATRGHVTLGGVDVGDIDREQWWRQIKWVPQSPTILPGSIRDNVLPDGGALSQVGDQSALDRAARATGFDRVIEQSADGWETQLGQGGLGLSVGQRQRLALTRTLVSPPKVLLLDEPTAHLDAVSEDQIVAVLRQLRAGGTTVIVIAHRQAVVAAADTVIPVQARAATPEEKVQYPSLTVAKDADGPKDANAEVQIPGFLDPAAVGIVEDLQR